MDGEIRDPGTRAAKRRAEKCSLVSLPVRVLATSAEHLAAIGHLQPLAFMSNRVTRMPLLSGNRLEPLHNGEQAYPAMLEAMASAAAGCATLRRGFAPPPLGTQPVSV